MNIKDLSKKSLDFTIKRVAEIIGILLICLSTLFFLSLISYSPEDPNFIFSENTIINNILTWFFLKIIQYTIAVRNKMYRIKITEFVKELK